MQRGTVERWRRFLTASIGACAIIGFASCSEPPKKTKTRAATPTAPTTTVHDAAPATALDAVPSMPKDTIQTVSLTGKTPTPVPQSNLRVFISGSFHKASAPVVGVSVLVTSGEEKAEVSWRIESGNVNSNWRPIEGRRYDEESSTYVEEEIPGWEIRLDSIEDQSAGGDPTAITISLRQP